MLINTIHEIDCLAGLQSMADKSVNCIVTSPPYYGLRDYGMAGQVGLEETPEAFIQKLVVIFRECRRILANDGNCWINIGDSYWGGKGASGSQSPAMAAERNKTGLSITSEHQQLGGKGYTRPTDKKHDELKPKDLIGIPWMLAFALRADGWYLRQDIIWSKPNPMPESVTDRCTKSHEYIFLLSKSAKYFYDAEAIKTVLADTTVNRLMQGIDLQKGSDRVPGKTNGAMKAVGTLRKGYAHRGTGGKKFATHSGNRDAEGNIIVGGLANKRSVWTVTTKPFSEAHFATFPEDLIVDCIKAGSSEIGCCSSCGSSYVRQFDKELIPGPKASYNSKVDNRDLIADKQDQGSNRMKDGHKPGWVNRTTTTGWQPSCTCSNEEITPSIILDPFMGAGTTALVSRKLNRNYIGFELNPAYIAIANKRLKSTLGMFK